MNLLTIFPRLSQQQTACQFIPTSWIMVGLLIHLAEQCYGFQHFSVVKPMALLSGHPALYGLIQSMFQWSSVGLVFLGGHELAPFNDRHSPVCLSSFPASPSLFNFLVHSPIHSHQPCHASSLSLFYFSHA
jgi:hypothetical protein